jgi:hypothetical protein
MTAPAARKSRQKDNASMALKTAATAANSVQIGLLLTKQHCRVSAADVLVIGSKACRTDRQQQQDGGHKHGQRSVTCTAQQAGHNLNSCILQTTV